MKKAEGAERSIKANGGFLFLPSRSSQRSFGFPYRQKVFVSSSSFLLSQPSNGFLKGTCLYIFLCAPLMLSFYLQKYVLPLAFCFDWYYDKSLLASK